MTTWWTYAAFGGRLRSALPFAELRAEAGDAGAVEYSWTLAGAPPAPRPADAEACGTARYAGGVTMRLWRHASGFWLETDDVGSYAVLDAGRRTVWMRDVSQARDERAAALARFDVLGRVLPLALHEAGCVCLHGSGVTLGGGAIALVAPKGNGKSTLALALARAGAGLLSDDVLPVDLRGPAPRLRPGVHAVRLWADSARQLEAAPGEHATGDRKLALPPLPDALLATAPAPLDAVYLLEPGAADAPESAARERLPSAYAAAALAAHATNARLLRGAEAPVVLARCARVADGVPVYRLRVARDFARLADAVTIVRRWHGGEAPGSGADAGSSAPRPVASVVTSAPPSRRP
ncbi:MAG TPA: hypothetical protein VHQ45_04740 [Gemmatimonadaceae bacterium]|jgi:hypothetical protein|nr:hypothetical protein [Gemmatimonadaceae bacterium]